MPEISRFHGIKVRMHFGSREHPPPHFHARSSIGRALMSLRWGTVGRLNARKRIEPPEAVGTSSPFGTANELGPLPKQQFAFQNSAISIEYSEVMSTVTNPLEVSDVTRVRVTGDHQLALRFRDGVVAELNLASWIAAQKGPMVEPLRSPAFFADVDLDDGVLTWPNGFDIDPLTVRYWADHGSCA
jgi:hypothetical protein